MANFNATCAIDGGQTLTLHPSLVVRRGPCWRAAFELVASRTLAIVVTWSAGSLSASRSGRYPGLQNFARHRTNPDVVALAYGKGSHCSALPVPLLEWAEVGTALCITGPNMGSREAHSVLHFSTAFYDHLPKMVVFAQDDAHPLPIGPTSSAVLAWAQSLKADAQARQQAARDPSRPLASGGGGGGGGGVQLDEPWSPTQCGCHPVREAFFNEEHYGGYRPIAWLLRTFFPDFANRTQLPETILWPAGAQFAAARLSIRSKPRAFWRTLLNLASPPAPLKRDVPRRPGTSDERQAKVAKWANFGRYVVDLGPTKTGFPRAADNRPGINGMDFAQLCERSWFRIFDPALRVALPPHLECYEAEALARGPVRCGTGQCPSDFALRRPVPGGCASTDELGTTTPPPNWRYQDGRNQCLADGCLAG